MEICLSFVVYWLNIGVKGYVGDMFSLPHVSKAKLAIQEMVLMRHEVAVTESTTIIIVKGNVISFSTKPTL